jgi:hypothetical protein
LREQLKTPYRDGTTHIVMEPLDLMARLGSVVSLSRRNCRGQSMVLDRQLAPR